MRFRLLLVLMVIDKTRLTEVVQHAGKSLTKQRCLIIETLAANELPMSAYELRDQINITEQNLNISTIYRVLDFWIGLGLIHKIESANRFMVCSDEHRHQFHAIQHCIRCENVRESCELASQMRIEMSHEFRALKNQVIEIQGTCLDCLAKARGKGYQPHHT